MRLPKTTKDMKSCFGFCRKCPQRMETVKDINGKMKVFITCGLDPTTRIVIK